MKRFLLLFLLTACGEVGPVHTRGDLCAERADLLAAHALECDQADDIDRMAECCAGAECAVYPSPDEYTVIEANLDQCALALEHMDCVAELPLPCEVMP